MSDDYKRGFLIRIISMVKGNPRGAKSRGLCKGELGQGGRFKGAQTSGCDPRGADKLGGGDAGNKVKIFDCIKQLTSRNVLQLLAGPY